MRAMDMEFSLVAPIVERVGIIRAKRREDQAEARPDPAVFPLATPLIAGPGAIASMILLTGEGDIPMAVDALGRGAFDFLEKPCPTDQLVGAVHRALEARRQTLEDRQVQRDLQTGDAAARLIFGASKLAEKLRTDLRQIGTRKRTGLQSHGVHAAIGISGW